MSATTDFVHDEEIVLAVIAQLDANLPALWTSGSSPILRLGCCQFGDLRDEPLPAGKHWRDLCPAIYVRLNRSERTAERCGLGGKEAQIVPLRLVHVRTREQCLPLDGARMPLPPARARPRYAKTISQALFSNRDLGNPTLTTADASARVVELRPKAVLYEEDLGDVHFATVHGLVALGIDFEVLVRTQ
ncbi:MAG: hypothetical protein FJX74_12110 [Armatimonadetes bacterium]|nr:hypothetical protein [Armatimonadota bacterium]